MKKLKLLLFFVLVAVMMFAMCSCMDTNTLNSYLGMLGLGTHTCADANGDTLCDTCGGYVAPTPCTEHVDNDEDGVCDKTGCNAVVLREMTTVVFKNVTKVYDGKPKSVEVKRAPEGAVITYNTKNTQTKVGTYKVTATITCDGYEDLEVTATLKINPKPITIDWGDNSKAFPADGKAPTLDYTLDGVIEGDTVNVSLDFGGHDFNKEGEATVTATLDNKNYTVNASSASTTILFGPNVRTVSFETGLSGKDLDPELVIGGEPVDEPRALSKNGYDFMGWYNGDVKWNFDDPVTEDMTLTARWELTKYTVTYYLNGGTNSPANPETFTVDKKVPLSKPTKDGALFCGWFLDENFANPAKQLGSVSTNISLYAKWSTIDYVELVSGKTIDSDNPSIVLTETAVTGAFTYTFVADITEFGDDSAVYIGRGKNSVDGSYVKITKGKVTVYTNGIDDVVYEDKVHVREMAGFLFVEITASSGNTRVVFRTGDGEFSAVIDWSGRTGNIFFDSENVKLDNACFGWYTKAYDAPTWIIGDETIGSPSETAYTKVLVENKFSNFLTIGANGLDAAKVFEYFKDACEVKTPKYAIWSFRADPAAGYDQTVADFVAYCKDNGIIPVLTTQSSTAAVDNTARNAAIRASGERYIDFAAMEVYDNVLKDGAYTTVGAKALYAKFMADFPEIVAAEATMRTIKADKIEGVSGDLLYPENYVASDDVVNNVDGTVKLKYGEFEEFRKESAEEVRASSISMNGNAIKDGKYLIFHAEIDGTLTEDQTIILGHGYMTSTAKWLEINGKYIWGATYQSWGTAHINPTSRKLEHKLTIKNYITVIVTCDTESSDKKVAIFTDGGSWITGMEVNGNAGDIFATSAGVELTNASLSWTCKDYAKDVWVFGDSYLSLGDPARWPTHMYYEKYYNALMVGASGMSAQQGLANLEDAIQYGTPKYIVWLEGMNNGEKNGVKNAGYHESIARLFEICEEYDIVPYIATIPNCPAAKHELKNNDIYNGLNEFAGKRYEIIDWARSVENFDHETLWYEGMLHTDNVHPTNLGAKALYMQICVDFPQIMGGWDSTVYTEKAESFNVGNTLTIKATETKDPNRVFAFTADFDGKLNGALTIGNGKGVEGGTWVEIKSDVVTVYTYKNGAATEVYSMENKVVVENLINVKIHVKGDMANVAIMSVGVTDDSMGNRVFNFDVSWNAVGDAFVNTQSTAMTDAKFSWYTHAD